MGLLILLLWRCDCLVWVLVFVDVFVVCVYLGGVCFVWRLICCLLVGVLWVVLWCLG